MDRRDEQASSENVLSLCARVFAEENLRAFRTTDASAGCRPASLDRRVRQLIRREYRRREHPSFYKYAGKIAAVLAIVCTVSLGAVLSVEAVRNSLWNAVIRNLEDCFSLTFVIETEPPESIESKREPVIKQENWKKEIAMDTEALYVLTYRDENGLKMLSYSQMILTDSGNYTNNKDTVIENVTIGELDGLLFVRNGGESFSLYWNDGQYCYRLTTFDRIIDRKELIEIAKSVR